MAQAEDTVWLPVLPSMRGFGPALVKGAGAEADKSGKSVGKRFGLAVVAGTAVVGAGALAVGKALYNVGEIFDDVADTIRVGTGATGKDLDGLVDVAKRVGSTVPASFEDIGSTVADVNTRMGLSGETLQKVSSQYLEAGRILGEEVDVNKTSAAFNAFKIEGEDVSGALDHLYQVSQATGMGMNELADASARNAPAMQTLGFSFEETTAMVGSFDKAGLNSSQIMASLSKGLVTMAKDGEKPAEAFKRVQGEISGFLEKGDEAGALNLASKVFGTRGATQFIGALKSGTLNLDDMSKAAGQTSDTILGAGEETMDFAEQWQLFKNKVLVWLEPLGTKVFGALGTAMDVVNQSVTAFGAAWEYNDGEITSSGIPGFMERLGYIAHQTFDLLSGGIKAFTAAWVYNDGEVTSSGFAGFMERLGYVARQTFDYFKLTVIPAVAQFGQFLIDNQQPIAIIAGVITALLLPAFIRMGVQALIARGKIIATFVAAKLEAIKSGAVFALQSLRIVGAWVLMGVQSLIQGARMAAAWILAMGPVGWVIAAVIGLAALVIANWDKISKFTREAWANIVGFVTTAWTNIKTRVSAAIEWVRSWILSKMLAIRLLWDAGWKAISDKVTTIWNGIKTVIASVYERGIKPVFNALVKLVTEAIPNGFRKGRDAIEAIWKRVANIARKPVNFVVGTVYNKGLKAMFNGIAGKLKLPWRLPDAAEIPAFAKGGQMGRGWKLVGEEGPELINTGPGYVYTAGETRRMLDGQRQMPMAAIDQGQQAEKGIGGFWGDVWGGMKSTVGKVKDWAVGMIGSAVKSLVQPIKTGMSAALPGAGMNELIRGAGFKLVDDMTGWATRKDDAAAAAQAGAGGGGFVGGYDGPLGRFYRPGGRITSGFGSSRGRYPHAGIDFAVPIGTAVKAMFDGIVSKIGWNAVAGRTGKGLLMTHGNRMNSYYGHLSGWVAKPGDRVKAGQTIARSGNTGNSTGPHLHAELWRNRQPYNYATLLRDQGGALPPGLSTVLNKTGGNEWIFNQPQLGTLENLAQHALAGRGGGPAEFRGDLFLDSGEFLGKVRGVARQEISGVARASLGRRK
ncbi:phage tail tape measure protein [Arthrobacter sp.]|uniref:phage tail tape measure protein n=1 Tax=Arthrobacter sp. TaxID=1667 RepID=UPI003A91E86F